MSEGSTAQAEVEEARHQVERTREQLGETVHALAEKADVKAQLHHKVGQAKARLADKASSAQTAVSERSPGNTDPVASAKRMADKLVSVTRRKPMGALAATFLAGVVLGRKSKRRPSG